MQIYRYPDRKDWPSLVERPRIETKQLQNTVSQVLEDIRLQGDKAVKYYEERFDKVALDTLEVTEAEKEEAEAQVSPELKEALELAHQNIAKFHESQIFRGEKIETVSGVTCWQRSVPIQKVGLYIPGGTAPLFSTVLMLATPAKIAGCDEIVLCSPPNTEGKLNPAILVAARIAGVHKIYKIGGVQAIGAMAYGTESVPKVFKIFGPGNQYVMAAKQQVSLHDVAIDMPAGPSEVCVIADKTSNAAFVAADLLSQAEHGTDSQVILLSTDEDKIIEVKEQVLLQINDLPRKEITEKTLENSKLILLDNSQDAIDFSNIYAPEHLIICTKDYQELAAKVVNAGSVFLGKYACESAGDYASGTNHTLPTHGYATAYSGVNLDSFCRKITYQHLTPEGIESIGKAVELMAENEQLTAHKNAMTLRIEDLKK